MSDTEQSGMTLGTRLFVAFLILATAGLAILTILLSRENRELRTHVEKLSDKVLAGGFIPGDVLEPITLEDADGQPLALDFTPDDPPTLLFLTSPGCDGCEQTIPTWEGALAEVGPIDPNAIRIICVRAGVIGEGLRQSDSTLWQCYGAKPGHEGWLRRIPVTPSAILIDGQGRVLQRWHGYMSESRAPELRMAIADILGH